MNVIHPIFIDKVIMRELELIIQVLLTLIQIIYEHYMEAHSHQQI